MSNTTLKSTFADVRKLDAKVVDAKNIKLNGQNVEQLWGLNLPKDYPKLVHGVKLPQDADYILCDSLGNPVYMTFNETLTNGSYLFRSYQNIKQMNFEFPNLTNGYHMFNGCSKLTSVGSNTFSKLTNGEQMFSLCYSLKEVNFELGELTKGSSMFQHCYELQVINLGNLNKLTDGTSMFANAKLLTSFLYPLPALNIGTHMFANCKLDGASVQNILTTIPTYTDGSKRNLHMGVQQSGADKFKQITGVTPLTSNTPVATYKGWSVYATLIQ